MHAKRRQNEDAVWRLLRFQGNDSKQKGLNRLFAQRETCSQQTWSVHRFVETRCGGGLCGVARGGEGGGELCGSLNIQ